ncbi:MAG TPA: beta-propeller fold lactonase family protein [Terriglobales bacterium]|jgi:6-phosphogluconolactonase (cycloisomerase 2 family)|nr:beta-propeller fold lactonase family protein [Terriglobales bacterium]
MSFLRAAHAALVGKNRPGWIFVNAAMVVILTLITLSCATNPGRSASNHVAYVTLPQYGSVLMLNIDGAHGYVALGPQTPIVEGTTPTGLALLPSRKFLYTANSFGDNISLYNVNGDGTLTLNQSPIPAGSGPHAAVIDPSGNYLLVTNSLSNNISVFQIDSSSGALTEVQGSPFYANASPTELVFAGQFVYVTNPGLGTVTGFSFANGVLTQVPNSPFFSGAGASALVESGTYLYVVNPSASNPTLPNTTGNVSGFNIGSNGSLTSITGSPFASVAGSGPSAITVDPFNRFVYAVTPQSSASIWCFSIGPLNGQLTEVAGSPFNLAGGGLFALFDPAGNFLFIGNQAAHAIEGYTYNIDNGALTLITGSPFSTTVPPGKMALSE